MRNLIYTVAIMFATLGFVSCGHSTESKSDTDSVTVTDSVDTVVDTTVVPVDTVSL